MTKWILKCITCGEERILEAGFNLAVFEGKIYLYCRKCKTNREQLVVGCLDDICPSVRVDVID